MATALLGGSGDDAGAGAAWVFTRSGPSWTQQAPKLTPSDENGAGAFGERVALSADGTTALIGGPTDNNASGAAWVFTRTGSTWTQQGPKLTPHDENGAGAFGVRVALSADGSTALIAASNDNDGIGAAWVFTDRLDLDPKQGPKLTADDESVAGSFGQSVALSADGNTALIGGSSDDNGNGAAWVFTRTGASWAQTGPKLIATDEIGPGAFGLRVALFLLTARPR